MRVMGDQLSGVGEGGRPPELAWQGWSHQGRYPGNPHSQDEPQEHQARVGAQEFLGIQRELELGETSAQPVSLAMLMGAMPFPAKGCFPCSFAA